MKSMYNKIFTVTLELFDDGVVLFVDDDDTVLVVAVADTLHVL